MDQVFVPVLLGTPREGRRSEYVARLLEHEISERDDITTHMIDVRDFEFPQVGYGRDINDQFDTYRDTVIRADGFVLIAPEYNHSFSGSLKSVLDLLLKEYRHKAVGIAGVSNGRFGGARVIESLLPVVRELGLAAISKDLNAANTGDLFDENGELVDAAFRDRVHAFLDELVWMSRTLRWGRENLEN